MGFSESTQFDGKGANKRNDACYPTSNNSAGLTGSTCRILPEPAQRPTFRSAVPMGRRDVRAENRSKSPPIPIHERPPGGWRRRAAHLGFAGSWTASDQKEAGGGDSRSRNRWHVTGPVVPLNAEVGRIIAGTRATPSGAFRRRRAICGAGVRPGSAGSPGRAGPATGAGSTVFRWPRRRAPSPAPHWEMGTVTNNPFSGKRGYLLLSPFPYGAR
jgi:hypothetical protein